jgi:hypothetical protein
MAPLIQQTVDLIGFVCVVGGVIPLVALPLAFMVMRQIGTMFGFGVDRVDWGSMYERD